jgi:hypothetical protein
MSRMPRAVTARPRLALSILVGGAVALLMASLFAATLDAPSAVVLTAVTLAVGAVLGINSRQVAALAAGALAPHRRPADEAPSFLPGRATDPAHHPLRPRAPGLV